MYLMNATITLDDLEEENIQHKKTEYLKFLERDERDWVKKELEQKMFCEIQKSLIRKMTLNTE